MRYVGQPVAVVVGETRALAEDAAERVEVDYEVLPPVVDPRAGESSRAGSSGRATSRARSPRAAHVVRTEHVIPRLAATPMETARRARRARGRAADGLVLVAERAPPARAARADARPATSERSA